MSASRRSRTSSKPAGVRHAAPRQSHSTIRGLAVLLAVVTLLVFANSLSNPFVFDDQRTVLDNPTIRSLSPLATTLSPPRQSSVAGRPVANFTFALSYAMSGESPWGYHLLNIAVHLMAGLLLFGIVRRTLQSRALAERVEERAATWLAFASALLWLVHPLQTEVINYVTQRSEAMMGLAYFATLYAAIRGMGAMHHKWWWYAAAIAACALGMATKEVMATAPLMVLIYDAVFEAGSFRRALRERPALYAGLAATWVIVAALVASGPRSNSAGLSSGMSPVTYLLNQPHVLIHYLRLVFWPSGLVLDYGPPRLVEIAASLPALGAILLLLALTLLAWRRHRVLAFVGTWCFVILAPTSSFVPIATEVAAERRMYLPLAAIIALVVVAAWRIGRAHRTVMIGLLAGTMAILATLTVRRNAEYHTTAGIWQTVLDRRPHGRARYNLGIELRKQGRRAEALEQYRLAAPDSADAQYALGFELGIDGQYADATSRLREYVRLQPDDINVLRAYNLLGRALMAQGKPNEAADAFRETVVKDPRDPDALEGLADALLQLERFDEAIEIYRRRNAVAPPEPNAHYSLGLALLAQGRNDQAIEEFRTAAAMDPSSAMFQWILAHTVAAAGRLDEADALYRRAVTLDPSNRELRAEADAVARQNTELRIKN